MERSDVTFLLQYSEYPMYPHLESGWETCHSVSLEIESRDCLYFLRETYSLLPFNNNRMVGTAGVVL